MTLSADPSSRGDQTSWSMRFAPHIGFPTVAQPLFKASARSEAPADQIAFIAEQGFAGIEDNDFLLRPTSQQDEIGQALRRHALEMGCCKVANMDAPASPWLSEDEAAREQVRRDVDETLAGAQRSGGRHFTLATASDPRLPQGFQMAALVENLKAVAPTLERAGGVICLEPIARARVPGRLLTRISEGFVVTRAVRSVAVKLIFDVVHVQLEEGNVIGNMEDAWPEIAVIQIGDVPGRVEPGTGELNFPNILRRARELGYLGLVELEHVLAEPGERGEQTMLRRLRMIDSAISQ